MHEIVEAFGDDASPVAITGPGRLASAFDVAGLATGSMAALGQAMARLIALCHGGAQPAVSVDARRAQLWFDRSIRPIGWDLPPIWDAVAGVYASGDGFIRLHTNLPAHRAAALDVLGVPADRAAVAAAVAGWQGDALEDAVVAAGGVAAKLRSRAEWLAHPQGRAVAAEPLVDWRGVAPAGFRDWAGRRDAPLNGLRVLDLTRVLAGPVATRALAGFGAEVLRIDPPGWDEANVVPDITLGKRCATLDLTTATGRERLKALLARADVIVHGYRPGALDAAGLGEAWRDTVAPGRIEVTLDAYGWTGPWAGRRGFDSLVQMSAGIAHAGMGWAGKAEPVPLPVQALDHATGYLLAAAVVTGLTHALSGGGPRHARLSLARTAELLAGHPSAGGKDDSMGDDEPGDWAPAEEATPWGPARRLAPALLVEGADQRWVLPACALGSAEPRWSDDPAT
ncbi:MAG: CoA transferase [Paracoccaceae bacterium]